MTLGLHLDRYALGSDRYNTADWISGPRGALAASSRGKTQTEALYLEDAVRLTPELRLTLGVRQEHWRAFGRAQLFAGPGPSPSGSRSSRATAPRPGGAGLDAGRRWRVTASVGQAYRFPTVSELYQAGDGWGPSCRRPTRTSIREKALSTELSVERAWSRGPAAGSRRSRRISRTR